MTAREETEVAGERLCMIGSSTGETDELGSTATQEDGTRFYGFSFDL